MQVIRTIVWVVAAVLLVIFIAINWTATDVIIWPLTPPVSVKWPLGLVVIASFVLGLLPMWLWSQAGRWRLKRRIAALENSVRAVMPTAPLASPAFGADIHQPAETPYEP